MGKLGLKPGTDVTIIKQGFNMDPLLQNQAACISTMIYNEYWQVIDAGVKETDLVTFFYQDQGVASLEDGLYVLAPNLKDKAFFVAKLISNANTPKIGYLDPAAYERTVKVLLVGGS